MSLLGQSTMVESDMIWRLDNDFQISRVAFTNTDYL